MTTPNACYADNVECKMHNLHGPPAKRGKADSMLAMHIRSRVFNLPSQLGRQGGGRGEAGRRREATILELIADRRSL